MPSGSPLPLARGLAKWRLGMAFRQSGVISCAISAVIAGLFNASRTSGIFASWLTFNSTRPMGVSFGNFPSLHVSAGGLGLGTIATGAIFLAGIAGTVFYMTKKDKGRSESR
jgi:uncharacterized membrane-anchored protein